MKEQFHEPFLSGNSEYLWNWIFMSLAELSLWYGTNSVESTQNLSHPPPPQHSPVLMNQPQDSENRGAHANHPVLSNFQSYLWRRKEAASELW